jgi:hypothetical protein
LRGIILGETELELKSQEIGETLIREGFDVGQYHGYLSVKMKKKHSN